MLVARLRAARDLALADEPTRSPARARCSSGSTLSGCVARTRTGGRAAASATPGCRGRWSLATRSSARSQDGAGGVDRRRHRPVAAVSRLPDLRGRSRRPVPATRFAGYGGTDGGLRDWMAWPRDCACPSRPGSTPPTRASSRRSAWPCARWIVLTSDRDPRRGRRCRPIGLLIVRACAARGATDIVATDRLAHRVDAARASGATPWRDQTDGRHPTSRRSMSRSSAPAPTTGSARRSSWCARVATSSSSGSPTTTGPRSARRSPDARA